MQSSKNNVAAEWDGELRVPSPEAPIDSLWLCASSVEINKLERNLTWLATTDQHLFRISAGIVAAFAHNWRALKSAGSCNPWLAIGMRRCCWHGGTHDVARAHALLAETLAMFESLGTPEYSAG